ncbi:20375_t:CDS:1, partial [Dentiscutata erythropus]
YWISRQVDYERTGGKSYIDFSASSGSKNSRDLATLALIVDCA